MSFHPTRLTTFNSIANATAAMAFSGVFAFAGPVAAATHDSNEGRASDSPKPSMASGTGEAQRAQQGESLAKQLPDRYKLSNWMGKSVQTPGGDKVGTVEELIMDDLGRVRYVVLKSEFSARGEGPGLVAVPTGHFRYPLARAEHLVLAVTPQKVQAAPTFDGADYPDMGHPDISSVIITYWLPEDAARQAQSGTGAARPGMHGGQEGQPEGAAGTGQQQAGATGDRTTTFDPNRDMVYLSQERTRLFEKLDDNEDGVIDRQEAEDHERLSEHFSEVDTYGNQAITRSEFAAFEIKDEATKAQDQAKGRNSEQRQDQPGMTSGDRAQGTTP